MKLVFNYLNEKVGTYRHLLVYLFIVSRANCLISNSLILINNKIICNFIILKEHK